MKTIISFFLSAAAILVILFSCQKEVRFDFISEGTLDKDINSDCIATAHGDFIAGKANDANNYIEVQAHVTTRGNYTITTDTVNGYSFTATGAFHDTGSAIVRLAAHGKPIAAGTDQFNIAYGSSHCLATVIVLNSSTAASFTLQGAPGSCMIDTVAGDYIKGSSLNTGSKVIIGVNVTVPGNYQIYTDTVNGYSFSSTGTFSAAGIQTVILSGSGKPVNGGTNVFTIKAGNSACNFSISVITVVVATNNDHFPLTMSSYWDYKDLYYQGNVVTTIIIGSASKNGNLYKTMEEEISPGGPLILDYRKTGSQYFEYAAVDKYTSSFQYATKIYGDLPFLKEGLVTGEEWQSPEYNDTASAGQVMGLQYEYSCLDANASIVIDGHVFTNVYKVQMKPKIRTAAASYTYTGELYTYYYAKGVGLIYYKEIDLGSTRAELQIKDWQVN